MVTGGQATSIVVETVTGGADVPPPGAPMVALW
jgi:hypothetical protein